MNSSMANRLLAFAVIFSCLIYSSDSYQFVLGWVAKPAENYNQWAGRMRFLVNDTIQFKYKGGADSVAVVSKDGYDKCDAANPIVKFDDGDSVFKFDRSGPFYFITANKANCDQGQKMIVVVLAIRRPPSTSPPSPPSPGVNAHSPTAAPPLGLSSPTPSPAGTGAVSPGPATSSLPPSPSSGASPPPASGPGGASSESPSSAGAPGSSTPGAGAGAPGSSTPVSGTPADVNSPPAGKRSMAAPPCSSCVYLISAASLVVSVGLGVFA